MSLLDSRWIRCPWCGERFETWLDPSAGSADYVEDCPVCCRPIEMHARSRGDDGDDLDIEVERE